MKYTLPKKDMLADNNLLGSDNIINVLLGNKVINVKNTLPLDSVNSYGESLSNSGSGLIAKFHSVHERKLYRGYDNYNKINKVAKLFEKKEYVSALKESGCENIKTFVENERETITHLREHISADLEILKQYQDTVSKCLSEIEKFINENNLSDFGSSLSFEQSVLNGKLTELKEIQESLIHIQSVNEVAIKFAIEGKSTLTVVSDGVLQNISMMSVVSESEIKEIWSGSYKEDVRCSNNTVNNTTSRIIFWGTVALTVSNFCIYEVISSVNHFNYKTLQTFPDYVKISAMLFSMMLIVNVSSLFKITFDCMEKGFSIKNELSRTFGSFFSFLKNKKTIKKEFRKIENAESDILILSENNKKDFVSDLKDAVSSLKDNKYNLVLSDNYSVKKLSRYRLFTPIGNGKKSMFTPERANIVLDTKDGGFIKSMVVSFSGKVRTTNFLDTNNSFGCDLLKSMRVIKAVGDGVQTLVPDERFDWYLGLHKKVDM